MASSAIHFIHSNFSKSPSPMVFPSRSHCPERLRSDFDQTGPPPISLLPGHEAPSVMKEHSSFCGLTTIWTSFTLLEVPLEMGNLSSGFACRCCPPLAANRSVPTDFVRQAPRGRTKSLKEEWLKDRLGTTANRSVPTDFVSKTPRDMVN